MEIYGYKKFNLPDNQVLKSMAADDYLISGFKGKKDKLTLIAKKTDKLTFSFDVPEDVPPNLRFYIINPQGQRVEGTDKYIPAQVLETGQSRISGDSEIKMKRLQLEYDPGGKFMKGMYKIEIYNNDNYMGACQIRLK